MNLSYFIATRYFRSKEKKNFITVLSRISMVGVAVGTMALVVVLSVFNGLEGLIKGLYASFDADLKVMPVMGKSFEVNDDFLSEISSMDGVEILTEVIEDNALVRYGEHQVVATLKGVSENFLEQNRFEKGYFSGDMSLGEGDRPQAILGRGLSYFLLLDLDDDFELMQVFYPKEPRAGSIDPSSMYNRSVIQPAGIFSIEKQYDDEYLIVPLDFAADLLEYGNKRSALEIKVADGFSIDNVKSNLRNHLGEEFLVNDSNEQHASLLMTIRLEKLFVFLTLTFILAVASFNIFFSLSMLAIEKKKDIAVLMAMGGTQKFIRSIYLKEGAIIAFSGALIGLLLGFLICWVQDSYGLVSLGVTSSIVDAYPVKMRWTDFLYTSLSVVVITLIASYRPALIASKVKTTMHL
ncbi:FtsX-like permease family protein [Cyclobacterium plantarum]|uniref:ABC transporter permease n=1 Tax=Cyclobacterium plantarum TaxID=2716263 RepID=A0ABX0H110_9BACT|nr:FtsX-like permease family protein [Cyclobacterium plantarum]NHE55284.1 ABC transporter permease [Cyclobacterium plantarum]